MSNPAMEVPTEKQIERLAALTKQLQGTVIATEAISNLIGDLRRELNSSRTLLSALKDVVGKSAYQWQSRDSWHDRINQHIAEIDKVLK